jgi:hypothetical protein
LILRNIMYYVCDQDPVAVQLMYVIAFISF